MGENPLSGNGADAKAARARRRLEQRAYAPARTPKQQEAAYLARRTLRDMDVRARAAARAAAQLAVPAQSESVVAADVADEQRASIDQTPPKSPPKPKGPRRPALVPLFVIAALIIGVVVGRAAPTPDAAASQPRTAAKATASGVTIVIPTSDRTPNTIGQTWFSRPQQASDRFLFYNAPQSQYQPSTVREVTTSTGLGSVYVAERANPANGVCLIFYGPQDIDGTQSGTLACASYASFLAHGIEVKVGPLSGLEARWTVAEITVKPFH